MLSNDMKRVALRILKALNVPEANAVADCIKHGRWDELVKIKFDPLLHSHKSVDQFRRACLAQEFLRKADFLDTSVDKEQVARDGFLSCERQCFEANRRLERFLEHPVLETELEISFFEIITRARAWVRNALGQIPDALTGRFGPGAVFESEVWRHRDSLTQYDKLRNLPHRSHNLDESLVDHLVWQTAYSHAWAQVCPTRSFPLVRGNRFTTVPKDATKDRGIAIEPGINVLGQLAIGDALKIRLKRQGIDLRGDTSRYHPVLSRLGLQLGLPWMGQSLHRKMARDASITGNHATIDLSNASDTISLNLVRLLLPDNWFSLLSNFRSPFTRFKTTRSGKEGWYKLEKFSSMGNGYTFELETLIFCSLAYACGAKIGVDTFVYGDDIIVPDSLSADLLAVLTYSGMTPNKTKTFRGSCEFRESCGGDFFLGHDVRPFYIKEQPLDPASWISLANNLRAWSLKWGMPELMAVRASVLDQIPADIRACRGPEELGDLVIHDDECKWTTHQRGSIRYVRVWRPVQLKRYLRAKRRKTESFAAHPPTRRETRVWVRELVETEVSLTAALIGLPSNGIAPRNSVDGYRFGFVAFS